MRAAIPSHQLGATTPGTTGATSTTGSFVKSARRASKSGRSVTSTCRIFGAIAGDAATGDPALEEELDEDGVSIRRMDRTRD